MTSTLSLTNSAEISAKRSPRPSAQRYSMLTVRPSIQPSSRIRCTKAEVHVLHPASDPAPKYPMVGSLFVCWAAAVNGNVAVPKSVIKSRRLMFPLFAPCKAISYQVKTAFWKG
jgi:hypothetical protein